MTHSSTTVFLTLPKTSYRKVPGIKVVLVPALLISKQLSAAEAETLVYNQMSYRQCELWCQPEFHRRELSLFCTPTVHMQS